MEFDRRHTDIHMERLEKKIDRYDERFDRHEEQEFARYDRMMEASEAALLLAQKNEEKLEQLLLRAEEPLKAYHNGKAGIVIIQTSGQVIKWVAGVGGAVAMIWAAITHFK